MTDIIKTVVVVLISGVFALLGGFLGAWFTRKTEYQKWIRQQRSVEFADFIKQLENVRFKASDFMIAISPKAKKNCKLQSYLSD
jgi:hypothetical protein